MFFTKKVLPQQLLAAAALLLSSVRRPEMPVSVF